MGPLPRSSPMSPVVTRDADGVPVSWLLDARTSHGLCRPHSSLLPLLHLSPDTVVEADRVSSINSPVG